MPTRQIHGIEYSFQQSGSGHPLVLLHGFTGRAASWQPALPFLTDRFCIMAPDLIGHGETDAPRAARRYRMEHVAADLAELIGRFASQPVHLLGYSMGGRLALYFARYYPQMVSRLVLESASPGRAAPEQRLERSIADEALAGRIEDEGIAAFVDYWSTLPLFAGRNRLPMAQREKLRAQQLTNRPWGLANSLRGMGTGVQPSLWEDLAVIDMPVCLIVGEQDPKFRAIAESMERLIRDVKAVIIPDAGHTTHLEQPILFSHAVREFLEQEQ